MLGFPEMLPSLLLSTRPSPLSRQAHTPIRGRGKRLECLYPKPPVIADIPSCDDQIVDCSCRGNHCILNEVVGLSVREAGSILATGRSCPLFSGGPDVRIRAMIFK